MLQHKENLSGNTTQRELNVIYVHTKALEHAPVRNDFYFCFLV